LKQTALYISVDASEGFKNKLFDPSALKIKEVRSFETSVTNLPSDQRYISEGLNRHHFHLGSASNIESVVFVLFRLT
jgi:hypothetical protein